MPLPRYPLTMSLEYAVSEGIKDAAAAARTREIEAWLKKHGLRPDRPWVR